MPSAAAALLLTLLGCPSERPTPPTDPRAVFVLPAHGTMPAVTVILDTGRHEVSAERLSAVVNRVYLALRGCEPAADDLRLGRTPNLPISAREGRLTLGAPTLAEDAFTEAAGACMRAALDDGPADLPPEIGFEGRVELRVEP